MNGPSLTPRGPSLQARTRNNNPDPMSEITRRLGDLSRRINDVSGSILRSAGIAVTQTLMTITRGLRVEGTLDVTGDAVFSGDLAVPNGSITNDALANPVAPQEFGASAVGWSAPASTWTTVASASLTVPVGFTRAIVYAIGWWRIGVETTTVTAYLNGRVVVGGELGESASVRVEAGDGGSIQGANVEALDGLRPGSTVTVSSDAYMSTAIAASGPNSARVSGVVLWLR